VTHYTEAPLAGNYYYDLKMTAAEVKRNKVYRHLSQRLSSVVAVPKCSPMFTPRELHLKGSI